MHGAAPIPLRKETRGAVALEWRPQALLHPRSADRRIRGEPAAQSISAAASARQRYGLLVPNRPAGARVRLLRDRTGHRKNQTARVGARLNQGPIGCRAATPPIAPGVAERDDLRK